MNIVWELIRCIGIRCICNYGTEKCVDKRLTLIHRRYRWFIYAIGRKWQWLWSPLTTPV